MSEAGQIALEMFKIIVRDEIGTTRKTGDNLEDTLELTKENADRIAEHLTEWFYNDYDESVECTEEMARDYLHHQFPEV